MTVVLSSRDDFTLAALRRVALGGESVTFSEDAVAAMRRAHETFQEYVEANRDGFIYLVTSGGGPDAHKRTTPEAVRERKRRRSLVFKGLAFGGEPLPEHTVRAAVLASLTMMVEGNTATHPERAAGIASLLDGPLPRIPSRGLTAAGELMPMFYLRAALPELEAEEGLSAGMLNGNETATGMAGVCALLSRSRLALAEHVLALSVEAFRAPLDAYDPALAELWGDPYEAEALAVLGDLLEGADPERRPYQAPVSYRILPRILGQAHRAVARLEQAAEVSLRQIASNPTYVLPSPEHPLGRTLSSAGYHNGIATAAIDAVTACWADLALIAHRHVVKLHRGRMSELPDRLLPPGTTVTTAYSTTYLEYVPNGFVEELRLLAQPSLLPAWEVAASEQDDVAVTTFAAYDKERRAAELFDAVLAVLAASASQALHVTGRQAPPPLREFLACVRGLFPPVESLRSLGEECERLAQAFAAAVLAGSPERP